MQAYSDPSRENDPTSLPDLEIFYIDGSIEGEESGYYYWFCFPGCLPESNYTGPFSTENAALLDARIGVVA